MRTLSCGSVNHADVNYARVIIYETKLVRTKKIRHPVRISTDPLTSPRIIHESPYVSAGVPSVSRMLRSSYETLSGANNCVHRTYRLLDILTIKSSRSQDALVILVRCS